MGSESEKKGIRLSDTELDAACGGSKGVSSNGFLYLCNKYVVNFDTLFYISSPNGCVDFNNSTSVPHCCENCLNCKKVTDPASLPNGGGDVPAGATLNFS